MSRVANRFASVALPASTNGNGHKNGHSNGNGHAPKALPVLAPPHAPKPPKEVLFKAADYQFKMIPADKLIIPEYQRTETAGSKKIRLIKENFNPVLFGKLLVAPRPNGMYAIMDGLGRFLGMGMKYPRYELDGHTIMVPCEVMTNVTGVCQEVKAFIGVNGLVRPVTDNQRFKAMLIGGDKAALKIVDMMDKIGVTIIFSYANLPNQTWAAGALLKAYNTLTEKQFKLLVKILHGYQRPDRVGTIERAALSAVFITGLVHFIKSSADLSNDLAEALRLGMSAADILQAATNTHNLKGKAFGGGGRYSALVAAFTRSAACGMSKQLSN